MVVTVGAGQAFQTQYQGALSYKNVAINLGTGILPTLSDLFVFIGKINNKYVGENTVDKKVMNFKTVVTEQNTVRFYEYDSTTTDHVVVNGAHLAAATTITVDALNTLKPEALLYNPATGETLRVTATPTSTTVTVTRGFGQRVESTYNSQYPVQFSAVTGSTTGGAADISDNQVLIIQSNIPGEKSTNQDTVFNNTTVREAATQIFRADMSISMSAYIQQMSSQTEAEKWKSRQDELVLKLFKQADRTFLMGKLTSGTRTSSTTTAGGNNLTTSEGFISTIHNYSAPINATALGGAADGTISRDKLDDMEGRAHENPADTILGISLKARRAINKIFNADVSYQKNLSGVAEDYGFRAKDFVGTFGDLKIVHCRTLDPTTSSGTDTKLEQSMLLIRPEHVGLLHVKDRFVRVVTTNPEIVGIDAKGMYAIADIGFAFAFPSIHKLFVGFTSLGV